MSDRHPARATMRAAAALLALLSSGACIRGSLPPIELYRLDLPAAAETTELARTDRPTAEGSVAIAPYRAPGLYGDAAIAYRVGETQYGTYPSREWAIPLGTMLGVATQRVLEATPITTGAALFDPPNERLSAFIWRGTIREFEEVDRGDQVWAAIALDVQLVRSADDSVVWTGSLHREARVPEGTMPAIVATLSRLAAEGITELAGQARTALSRSGSASAQR